MKEKKVSIDVIIEAPDPEMPLQSIKEHLQQNRYVVRYCVREMCHCGAKK